MNKMKDREITREEELTIITRAYIDQIRDDFGFELTWSEEVAFKYYIHKFGFEGLFAARRKFMIDYFGIDIVDLGRFGGWKFDRHGVVHGSYWGLNLLGDKRFKEYFREKVREIRDERELI